MKQIKYILVYDSRTGNVESFCNKLSENLPNLDIKKITSDCQVNENAKIILVTYTDGYGNVPPKTINFINKNYCKIKAVMCSGNRNWGQNFANAGKIIADKLKIPLLHQFELRGTTNDLKIAIEGIQKIMEENDEIY